MRSFPVTAWNVPPAAESPLPDAGRTEVCDVSVLVPVFNNEATLAELHRRLTAVLEAEGVTWEIVFADDGSRDGSWAVISELTADHANTVGIRFSRNFGQVPAFFASYAWSAGQVVVLIDADLENVPEDLPAFLAKVREGHDLVTGVRPRRRRGRVRRWPSALMNRWVGRMTGREDLDVGCSFIAIRRPLADELVASGEVRRNLMIMPVLMRLAESWAPIPVRWGGTRRSGYSLFALAILLVDCLFVFGRPFYWTIVIGAGLVGAGLVALLGAIGTAIVGHGTAALVTALVALAAGALGFQLTTFGLFANHMVRTSLQRGTPYFQVRSIIGVPSEG